MKGVRSGLRASTVLLPAFLLLAFRPSTPSAFASPAPGVRSPDATSPVLTRNELLRTLARLAALSSSQERSREWMARLALWSRSPTRKSASEILWTHAVDAGVPESDRYLCLQAAAELAGNAIAPRLESLLHSRSGGRTEPPWMLRSAAIQSLARLNARDSGDSLIRVLREESALVVRLEAVRALAVLRPAGAEAALLAAAEDPRNWNGDRPIWVPERAIRALEGIRGENAPVPASARHPLRAKIAYWKAKLAERAAERD